MANQVPPKQNIKEIAFKHNDKFSSEFVTGVYGGYANNGTISINFFRDKLVLPDKLTVEVEGNRITKEIKRVGGNYINRDIFFEAIVDTNTAKVVVEWLLTKIAEHEKLIKKEDAVNNNI